MKKITTASAMLIALLILTAIMYYKYGLFTEANYFTAKADIKKGNIRLLYWGEPDEECTATILKRLTPKYHFHYSAMGCTIDQATRNGSEVYNSVMKEHLVNFNGENWFEKFTQELDSLSAVERKQ